MVNRVVVQELRARSGTTKEIADLSGVSEGEVLLQLTDLNSRVCNLLGYSDPPITVSSAGAWKVDGIAGLIRLNSQVELEVVPKFLDPSQSSWRTDFFLIAVLVHTGHLLLHDEISAATQERGDLATLIARSLLTQHAENERRPIRRYQRTRRSDFAIDGDVDWESTVLPDHDGFSVSGLELSRKNSFNATMAAAVQTLIPEVSDVDTQSQLRLLARHLGPQAKPPSTYDPLPLRHQGWQQAYDLSRLVVDGLGLNLDEGAFSGPGFVLSTWAAWETLCEEVVRRALPDHRVTGQQTWVLGHRGGKRVLVKPDISPMLGEEASFLLDAKYRTRFGRKPAIDASDLYESLAFLRASEAGVMFLMYPAVRVTEDLPLGEWRCFDEVVVDDLTIAGYEVQVCGVAQSGGFDALVTGARTAMQSHASISP